jgi:rod shape-determining protein MreB
VLLPLLKQLTEAIRDIIERTPPELSGDILRRGIYFSGGGSLLRGLIALVEKELAVHTILVDDPLTCVVRGAGIAAENIDAHINIFSSLIKPIVLD